MNQPHPIQYLVEDHPASQRPPKGLAILSPQVQSSFVFHLALARLLSSTTDDGIRTVVTVIGSSKTTFQQRLAEENDAFLIQGIQNDEVANLLERIEFRFCANLSQLVTILYDLGRLTSKVAGQGPTCTKAPSRQSGLILTDLSACLSSSRAATLSDLTRILGFLSSTQSHLSSSSDAAGDIIPVYLVDRLQHTEQWPICTNSKPDDMGSVLKVFQHFFDRVWYIEPPLDEAFGSSEAQVYKLHSSCAGSGRPHQITYQILNVAQEGGFPETLTGPLRKTVMVEQK